MNFKPVVGLEIHLELNTKHKAFSRAKIDESEPNTLITPIDLGYPGFLPYVNKKMVFYAYTLAKALNMTVKKQIHFDRKNYFYPDLAKGYQITQFFKPIGTDGYLPIYLDNKTEKLIKINEIHMEEDTAKQSNEDGVNKFDFNRAGIPLIEIVTDYQDFNNVEEVLLFVEQFQNLVRFLNISDALLEKGTMRVDVNISLMDQTDGLLRNRVEVKNINSIENIKRAINYEVELQTQTYLNNEEVLQTTKRWDEEEQKTITMRVKGDQDNYSYVPETNLPQINLSDEDVEHWENSFESQIISYKEHGKLVVELDNHQINNLFNHGIQFLSIFKEMTNNYVENMNNVYNFLFVRLVSIFELHEVRISDLNLNARNLINLFNLLDQNKINNDSFKKMIEKIIKHNWSNEEIDKHIDDIKNTKMLSAEEIVDKVKEIINNNKDQYDKFIDNEKKLISFLMGNLLKETSGKVNPVEANRIIKEMVDENK